MFFKQNKTPPQNDGVCQQSGGWRETSSPFFVQCLSALSASDVCQINLKAWAH